MDSFGGKNQILLHLKKNSYHLKLSKGKETCYFYASQETTGGIKIEEVKQVKGK